MSQASKIALAMILLSFLFLALAFLTGCASRFSTPPAEVPTHILK